MRGRGWEIGFRRTVPTSGGDLLGRSMVVGRGPAQIDLGGLSIPWQGAGFRVYVEQYGANPGADSAPDPDPSGHPVSMVPQ